MKIAYLSSWLNRNPHATDDATGIYVKDQIKSVQGLGVEAALLFPDLMPDTQLPIFPKIRLDTEGGIPTFRLQQFFPPKWSPLLLKAYCNRGLSLFHTYLQEFGRPDLIHAHNYWSGFIAQTISKQHQIPYLLTEHQTSFLKDNGLRSWVVPYLSDMLNGASALVAVSDGLKNNIAPMTRQSIMVIPNAVDTTVFSINSKPKASENNFQFISVGGNVAQKGYDLLLVAFEKFTKRHPSVKAQLCLIGCTIEIKNLLPEIIQLIDNQIIVIKGQHSRAEIVTALQSADCFVSSSRFETFGVAMAEAMAVGLPILATPTEGARHILTKDCGILTDGFSVEALLRGLEKMYEEYRRFSPQIVRQHVVDNFSPHRVGEQYLALYRQILT